jgi:hypothetical protein
VPRRRARLDVAGLVVNEHAGVRGDARRCGLERQRDLVLAMSAGAAAGSAWAELEMPIKINHPSESCER